MPRNGLILINGDDENAMSLKPTCPAPVKTVGLGAECDERIVITASGADTTDFTINGSAFTVPMNGEFNVRNAAMAICAARFGGLSDEQIAAALVCFKGVFRRQTERGEKNGIKVIDDFGHHPTAIRETLRGLRNKYQGARLWAVFEPRSNTSRRKRPPSRPHGSPQPSRRLRHRRRERTGEGARKGASSIPNKWLQTSSPPAASATTSRTSDAIVSRLKAQTRSGDVIIIFSNGGFDGIHDKLLTAL